MHLTAQPRVATHFYFWTPDISSHSESQNKYAEGPQMSLNVTQFKEVLAKLNT